MKKLIGIVPRGVLCDMEQSNMSDKYELGNNYIKRVSEAGGIPMGVTPIDGKISEDVLERFDGFVVQGGTTMWPYHFQIIHHAVTHGKRYLGICMGMQLIHCYFSLRKMVEDSGQRGDFIEQMYELFHEQEKEYELIERVEGHYSKTAIRGKEDEVKHDVKVVPGTMLHRLMNQDRLRGATYHKWRVHDPVECLTINAWAEDKTIEGIEYGDNILGVQFHPEVDGCLLELFGFLVADRLESQDT